MTNEPETLYKLIILYLLDHVSFSLSNSQISHFLLEKDYTSYFTMQRVLNDMIESRLITSRKAGNSTYYAITKDGQEALGYFVSDISDEIVTDIDSFLKENKFSLRSQSSAESEYKKTGPDQYDVHFMAMEGNQTTLSMNIIVPDEDVAKEMCANWKGLSQKIYQYLMLTLTGGKEPE